MTKFGRFLRRSDLLRNALSEPERKNIWRILFEAANYGMRKNRRIADYFRLGLYRKSAVNPLEYIGRAQNQKWIQITIDQEVEDKFLNKLKTQNILSIHGIKFPKIIGHYCNETAFVEGNKYPVRSPEEVSSVLSRLFANRRKRFFAKPISGLQGKGAFRLTPDKDSKWIFNQLKCSEYIFQEEVKQHPSINEIYPGSVNTMRVVSCISPSNGVKVALARMRFGSGDAEVDNVSSGGISVLVDMNTGCLKGPGVRQLKFGGGTFARHPDTGIVFDGFRVPFFESSIEMIYSAAMHLKNPVVGWDVAIAEDGPLLLEANQRPDAFDDELVTGPYVRNPVLGPFILEITDGNGL